MKKGFTLAEIVVTIGVVGLIAIITLPMLKNAIPNDREKRLYQKAYFNTEKYISELINTEKYYGADRNDSRRGFANLKAVNLNGEDRFTNDQNQKFCELFLTKLKIIPNGTTCSNQIENFEEGTIPERAFTTSDGAQWILPVSNFSVRKKIYIDVNGPRGENCYIPDQDTCKNPDRFGMIIFPDGRVQPDPEPWNLADDDIANEQGIVGGNLILPPPEEEPDEPDYVYPYRKLDELIPANKFVADGTIYYSQKDPIMSLANCSLLKARNNYMTCNGWPRPWKCDTTPANPSVCEFTEKGKALNQEIYNLIKDDLLEISLKDGSPTLKEIEKTFEYILKRELINYYKGDNFEKVKWPGHDKHGGIQDKLTEDFIGNWNTTGHREVRLQGQDMTKFFLKNYSTVIHAKLNSYGKKG